MPERFLPYYMYGVHPIQAALDNPRRKLKRLLCSENGIKKLRLRETGPVPIILRHARELDKYVGRDAVHQGVVMQVAPLKEPSLQDLLETQKTLVMLDRVTDPHNVGAILRSCAAFDVGGVILPTHHSPNESGVLAKSASGALDVIPLHYVKNLADTISTIHSQGYHAIGLAVNDASITIKEVKTDVPTLLVMGAEGKGLRPRVAESCTHLAHIPIKSQMESLNVSNAAAVALYELSA